MRFAAVLALLVAAAAGASSSAATPPPDLLRTFEPVLLFHGGERWAPGAVESFRAEARVEQQTSDGGWHVIPARPLPGSNAGCTRSPCFRFDLPCPLLGGVACYLGMGARTGQWQRPVVYGRVVPTSTGYLVRYWLFYEFDDWHSLHSRLWQAHEADWESVTVAVDKAGQPQLAAYSEHCSGTVRPWSAVTKRGGTHPVVYVALGSHANYFTDHPSSTRFTECLKSGFSSATVTRIAQLAQEQIVDRTGTSHPLGPEGLPGVTPLELVELDPSRIDWARFPGRWSEGQLLWLGARPRSYASVSQGGGPATPHWSSTSISSLWHVESS
jgi:hypothetical protein